MFPNQRSRDSRAKLDHFQDMSFRNNKSSSPLIGQLFLSNPLLIGPTLSRLERFFFFCFFFLICYWLVKRFPVPKVSFETVIDLLKKKVLFKVMQLVKRKTRFYLKTFWGKKWKGKKWNATKMKRKRNGNETKTRFRTKRKPLPLYNILNILIWDFALADA